MCVCVQGKKKMFKGYKACNFSYINEKSQKKQIYAYFLSFQFGCGQIYSYPCYHIPVPVMSSNQMNLHEKGASWIAFIVQL